MGPRIEEGVKFHPFPWLRYCTLTFAKALQRCIFTTHDHICNIFLQSLASPAASHLGTRAALGRAKKAVKTCPAHQPTPTRRQPQIQTADARRAAPTSAFILHRQVAVGMGPFSLSYSILRTLKTFIYQSCRSYQLFKHCFAKYRRKNAAHHHPCS